MKLTREQLLKIVQEELLSVLKESGPPWIRKRRGQDQQKDKRIPLYVPRYEEPPDEEEEEEEEEIRRGTTYINGGNVPRSNIPSSNIPEGKMFKLTRTQLKKIIREEMLGTIRESGDRGWRERERNVGLDMDLASMLDEIPPEKIQSDYERGFSNWITRQIINNKIGQEDLDDWKNEWHKTLSDPHRQLKPDAVENIIVQGIADALNAEDH